MPLGFERLNERKQRPNASINFIKPLASASEADQAIAQDFLERIAAQCYPVMKEHHISVMALEEYPANREFLGRNFNAGEVIQLVLKDKAGRWLGFKFVQMVMMHELAHCKHMNHSRYFWKERNVYADRMKDLWQKGYKGEGLWGKGKNLSSGRFVTDHMPEQAEVPEHLCGGTYRRARGKKRKRDKESSVDTNSTYAERQQRRISRKFGKHGDGNALGEDDLVRGGLERGHRHYGKPKVAQSKRGRELRANAALARLENAQRESRESTVEVKSEPHDSETESEWSENEDGDDGPDTTDMLPKIKDEEGHDLVRVCGDEGGADGGGSDEMSDLMTMRNSKVGHQALKRSEKPHQYQNKGSASLSSTIREGDSMTVGKNGAGPDKDDYHVDVPADTPLSETTTSTSDDLSTVCPICSLANVKGSPTCIACAHVLKPGLVSNSWRCGSQSCQGTKYINAGDAGRCGICGALRPARDLSSTGEDSESKAISVMSSKILRWD